MQPKKQQTAPSCIEPLLSPNSFENMTTSNPSPTSVKKFRINVVTGQGGGGHYAAYHALRAIAEQQNLPWEFQVTDMDDIITELSQQNQIKNAYEMFGFSGHDLYNLMLKSGWTWMWPLKMRLNKFLVKLNHAIGVQHFEKHWQEQQPDLVVSVMPLYNKGIAESLQRAKPGTPCVTVMVDFADYPPAFWMEPETDSYIVCVTEKAIEQARSLGVQSDRIVPSSGLVIHPRFYEPFQTDRRVERQRLGLDPDRLTAVVMFGGNGSQAMVDIAQQLEYFHDDLQLILLCGHNEALADALRQYQGPQNRCIKTFTTDIPHYMALADFFVGKPGPASLSEALAMRLPVITECNHSTLIHERYNTVWIEEKQVGLVLRNFRQIRKAVEQFLEPKSFAYYQSNVAFVNNHAVFEVSDFLQHLLVAHYPTTQNHHVTPSDDYQQTVF